MTGNRYLGNGHLKGCNYIRKWRKIDVGLNNYEKGKKRNRKEF